MGWERLLDSPSMVVTALPPTVETGSTQERTGSPSTWTVQAPHMLMPQPNLVPGSLKDRKSTRLNSSHLVISYAVFCLKKKSLPRQTRPPPPTGSCRRCRDRGRTLRHGNRPDPAPLSARISERVRPCTPSPHRCTHAPR